MTEEDVRRPLTPEQLKQLRQAFAQAWAIAEENISSLAGRDFLAALLADADGEIVLNIALKGRCVRVCVHWPSFSQKLETVCELQVAQGGVAN